MTSKASTLAAALTVLVLALAGCGGSTPGETPAPGGAGPAPAGGTGAKTEGQAQTTCPVMDGNKINKAIYTDYQGKRIYFCCQACPPEFAKDPDKYIKQMEAAGIVLEKAPAAPAPAPATGG